MASDNGNGGAVLVAFILGAIAGAATALLLTPNTGEEMRRVLAEKAREGRERATDAANKSREFIDRQRETLSQAMDRGKEAYQRARGAAGSGTPEEKA
jgi:gas vesicle protein